MYTLMKSSITLEGPQLTVHLTNPLQEATLREEKKALLGYLHEKIGTHTLQIVSRTQIQEEKKKYSNEEKLLKFLQTYPEIAELKNELALE